MNPPTIDTIVRPSLTEHDEAMLTKLIKMLMKELQGNPSNLFDFQVHSTHLLRKFTDPPFEFLCLYLATAYHNYMCIRKDPLSVAKLLFELSRWLSTPCNALKRVAIIAPIIHVLHKYCVDLSKADVYLKGGIENLLEEIVSHIILCCGLEDQRQGVEKLSYSFTDMMRVWTINRESDCKPVDHLRLFFPLISDEVRLQISMCYRTDYLAGAVMVEILLLMLQFKLSFGVCGINLQMDISAWLVQTLKKFKNFIFYGELVISHFR